MVTSGVKNIQRLRSWPFQRGTDRQERFAGLQVSVRGKASLLGSPKIGKGPAPVKGIFVRRRS
jgi:hypothetical protein